MFDSIVWLFPQYRRLYQENLKLSQALESAIKQLEQAPANLDQLLSTYNERVLQELPYEGGKIPDNVWLTPGEDR